MRRKNDGKKDFEFNFNGFWRFVLSCFVVVIGKFEKRKKVTSVQNKESKKEGEKAKNYVAREFSLGKDQHRVAEIEISRR